MGERADLRALTARDSDCVPTSGGDGTLDRIEWPDHVDKQRGHHPTSQWYSYCAAEDSMVEAPSLDLFVGSDVAEATFTASWTMAPCTPSSGHPQPVI